MRPYYVAAAIAAFSAWAVFLGAYSLRARWWRSPEGRNVWLVTLALVFAFGVIVAAYIFGDYAIRPYAILVVYLSLAALGVQRTVQMLRQQRRKRDH